MDEHKSVRENMKEMTGAERMRYFLDYYLVRTLVLLGAAAFVFHLIWHYTHLPAERVLYAFVIHDLFDEDEKNRAVKDMAKLLSVKEEQILLDDGHETTDDGNMQISTLLANERLDLIICPRDEFVKLAGEGTFEDLTNVLGAEFCEKRNDSIVSAPGYKEQDVPEQEDPFHEAGNGKGEVLPYGIVISEGERYSRISLTGGEFIAGVAANSHYPKNAETAILFFIGE